MPPSSRPGGRSPKRGPHALGLVPLVDERVGPRPGEKVNTGVALKAAILNALGFVSSPLYLFGHYWESKLTEWLLGKGVTPGLLNDEGTPGLPVPGTGPACGRHQLSRARAVRGDGGRFTPLRKSGPSASPTATAGDMDPLD